jgi:bile acid:Na+ symporter, BASS family
MLADISHFLHKRFLWLLMTSYVVAAFCPVFGLWIRRVSFGEITVFQGNTISLPMVMLAFLLFNAGLGVQTSQLHKLARSPLVLIAGLTANLIVPLAFIWCMFLTMQFWHNPDEVQSILVGLALIVAMPIAGSSTAWTQNANGDMTLSLALVLFSTVLSPLTTPFAFDVVGNLATGEYFVALADLKTKGTGFMLWVVIPSVLGIIARMALGEAKVAAGKPFLKLVNSLNLLLLVYSNASTSLPQTVANPDWDFLAVVLTIVLGMCVLAFSSGWLLAHFLNVDRAQRTSLMFSLGMNNNGTGLVLASMALSAYPRVMLPIIFYNLIQHLVAGCVDLALNHPAPQVLLVEAEAGNNFPVLVDSKP